MKYIKDSKRIWNGFIQIIHFEPPTSHRTIKIIINSNVITDRCMIANMFNIFLINGGKLIVEKTLLAQYQMLKCLLQGILRTPPCNSLFISPITAEENTFKMKLPN